MRQLTFTKPTQAKRIWPDGREELIRFGYFESVMITSENGWPVNRTKILIVPSYPVTEVVCADGNKLIFDEPQYLIEKKGLGYD